MLHSFTSIIKFVHYTFVIIMYMHNNNIMIMHEIHVWHNSIIIVVSSCLHVVTTAFYRLLLLADDERRSRWAKQMVTCVRVSDSGCDDLTMHLMHKNHCQITIINFAEH